MVNFFVVVSALSLQMRDVGLILGRGSYLRQVFFSLNTYVDPALIRYLDVSRILRTWRRCGMVDDVSYVLGPAQALVIIHIPKCFNCLSEQGMYRPTCSAASTLSLWVLHEWRGHEDFVYKYTWSIGNCATWFNIPAPSSCRSLVAVKPLIL